MKLKLMLFTCSSVLALNVHAEQPKFDMAACSKLVPQIKSLADACIKLKDQSPRQQCFDKIGQEIQKSAPNGVCDQLLNPIKQEYMAKEKQLYSMQATAIGNNGQQGNMGSQNGGQPMKPGQGQPQMSQPQAGQQQMGQPQAGQPQMGQPQMGQPQMGQPQAGQPQAGQQQMLSAAVCDKLSQTIKPIAEECLKLKEQPKRTQCFDKVGQEIKKVASNGGCDKGLEPLKREMMSKEKQLYPTQTSALK